MPPELITTYTGCDSCVVTGTYCSISREESSLVDIFVLEILVNYLESLSLAHNDDQARGKAICTKFHTHRLIHVGYIRFVML